MRLRQVLLPVFLFFASGAARADAQARKPGPSAAKGIRIEDLTWVQAERVLDSSSVVVIPLGAESKEH